MGLIIILVRGKDMEFSLNKIGIINQAIVKLNGLTVICGSNNSGKSTAGKALYATIESLSNLEEKLHNELTLNYHRALMTVTRILDLESVGKYVDFEKLQEVYHKDISILSERVYRYRKLPEYTNVVDAYVSLKEAVELLDSQMLSDFTIRNDGDLSKRFWAFLDNFEESKQKALSFLDSLDKYYFDEDLQDFSEKSAAALFAIEFNGQVFPVNTREKDKESTVSISKNGELGCCLSIYDKNDIVAVVHQRKLFFNNAIYIDDPYALDRLARDDESLFRYRSARLDYSHYGKLSRLLLKKISPSLIEASINKEKYDDIVSKISSIIPGTLVVKDSGIYYEESDKEPLKVQNLATGSKMFSIIKNLLIKGEINFDTMLILDEPESHLHPEWQNIFAEIMVLMVKDFNANILLTTHSPNFLMAIEAYAKKYDLSDKANYYMAIKNSDNYTVDYICVNNNLSKIYSSFARPLVSVKQLRDM